MAAQNKWSNPDGASFVNFALKANSIQYENVGCLFGTCKAYYSTHMVEITKDVGTLNNILIRSNNKGKGGLHTTLIL